MNIYSERIRDPFSATINQYIKGDCAEQVTKNKVGVLINGEIQHADTNTLAHSYKLIGLICHSETQDKWVHIQTFGIVKDTNWGWDLNKPILVGLDGDLVQNVIGTKFVQIIGYPISTTKIFIKPETAIRLA